LEIGIENASMRRVAERLGVSLPGLYHHVKNHDELLRLVARRTLADSPPPRYEGQHWASWLRGYASYVRSALSAEPALLEKFLAGAVHNEGEIEYIGDALEALHAQGLKPDEALDVWAAVTAMAIGSVSEAHREQVHAENGEPWLARIFAAMTRHAPTAYPTLRATAQSGYDPFGDRAFDHRITLLLNGVAARYGLSMEPGG
jgi:AcrR family transcriptional regulator